MSRLPTKRLNPNEILFKEGSTGELAYVIKKGSVEVSVMTAGQKVVLAILEPPAIFGEMALIFKEEKRTATVTALEYSELVQIEKLTFDGYFQKSPPIMEHMVNALVNRLKRTTDRVGATSDKFIGTAEILNLMGQHAVESIDYTRTLVATSIALAADTDEIAAKLDMMQVLSLIDILTDKNGVKTIVIQSREKFMTKARKLQQDSGGAY
jgi:CRP/FNR family cyclic AMP-dependent transcriptional regulator